MVYTDIKKAFDRINHNRLLAKLQKLGIYSSLLSWLSSYLYGRMQHVRICCYDSWTCPVLSGILQGSHLGPLLFLLFFDDIAKVTLVMLIVRRRLEDIQKGEKCFGLLSNSKWPPRDLCLVPAKFPASKYRQMPDYFFQQKPTSDPFELHNWR